MRCQQKYLNILGSRAVLFQAAKQSQRNKFHVCNVNNLSWFNF